MPRFSDGLDRVKSLLAAFRMPHAQRTMAQRMMLSSSYTVAEFGLGALLRIVSTIVLSRLLEPSIFGVFAIVLMLQFLVGQFTDVGFRPIALSHEDGLSHQFLQSIWTAKLIRGGCLFLLICGLGSGIGVLQSMEVFPAQSAYSNDELPAVIMLFSVLFLFDAFMTPNRLLYEADLNFDRIFCFEVFFLIFGLIVNVASVWATRSVWGLAYATLTISAAKSLVAMVLFNGAPFGLKFIKKDLWLFVDRGKWVLGSSLLTSLARVADRVLFGLLLPDSQFGLYFIATQISSMIPQFLQKLGITMGIQVFRHLHESPTNVFRRGYYKYRLAFDGLALISCGLLAVLAPLIVDVIYEDRYAQVAEFLQILAFSSIFAGPVALRQAFVAKRNFTIGTICSLLRMVTIWGGVSLALLWFDSVTMALCVVALQFGPESVLLLILGRRRGWVSYASELRTTPLFLVGVVLGLLFDCVVRNVIFMG